MNRLGAGLTLLLLVLLGGCRSTPEPIGPKRLTPFKGSLTHLQLVGPTPMPALRERVVLVNFLATWCFPCLVELPALEGLQKKYAERGFTVVAVGMDLEGAKVLRPFADHYRLPFPVLVATEEMTRGESPYGVIPALPTSFLLDRDGEVKIAWAGVAKPEEIADQIEKALR